MQRVVVLTLASDGGAARYVRLQVEALAAAGVMVVLICPADFEGLNTVGTHPSVVVRTTGIGLASPGTRLSKGLRVPGLFARTLRALPDLTWPVHAGFLGQTWIAASIVFCVRTSGRRIILTVHDVVPHHRPSSRAKRWVQDLGLRVMYRSATVAHVHAASQAEELESVWKIGRGRIAIIPHAAEPPRGLPKPARRDGPVRIALLGVVRPNKGIEGAVQAALALEGSGTKLRLVVRGDVRGDAREYWQRVSSLVPPKSGAVCLVSGVMSSAEYEQELAAADIVLLPYLEFHSQSGVAVDALAHGKPIAVTPVGGLSELVTDSRAGFIARSASQDDVRALLGLIAGTTPESLAVLGSNGEGYVRTWLSWNRVVAELIRIYTAAMENPRG